MITEIKKRLADGKSVLFVGPMSKNLVDAAIKFVYDFKTFLPLIASRRQIDFNRGYVNNWTTREYAQYVKSKDPEHRIILCRDHGGPNQGNTKHEDYENSIIDSKVSFRSDIKEGFDIIHIDTVKVKLDFFPDDNVLLDESEMMQCLYDLYLCCSLDARDNNKEIEFEIGMESVDGTQMSLVEFSSFLNKSIKHFVDNNLKLPLFCVAQTGTHVKETRNMGELIPGHSFLLSEIKNHFENIYLKEHNADYLSTENLQLHRAVGINALNIAPEFGYSETIFLVNKFFETKSIDLYRRFLKLAYESKKWERWVINDKLADESKALIAGHYIFAKPEFLEIKKELNDKLGYDVDEEIVQYLSNKLLKYYINLEIL